MSYIIPRTPQLSTIKRINGDYTIINRDSSLSSTGNVTISTNILYVDGNLVVGGNATAIHKTDLYITDNIITLNQGETGAGVTLNTSGISINRGSLANVQVEWNESKKYWELTNDGSTYQEIIGKQKMLIYKTLL
jgi:hypothetical protein